MQPAAISCPQCGAQLKATQKFCGECGHRLGAAADASSPSQASTRPRGKASAAKTMFFGAMQAARAKLVLIKGDGLDGVSFSLAGNEHVAGRVGAALLFEEDPYLAPSHANFLYRGNQLVVQDLGSGNGVFIRIRGAHTIQSGARFLVGEQLLEVRRLEAGSRDDTPRADGTYFYASPRRGAGLCLVQLLRGGDTALACYTEEPRLSLGREGNDINFPDDPFISGRHAELTWSDQQLTLTDLGSKNGTFLRIDREVVLQHGDYVFMGQQLLRVEIV